MHRIDTTTATVDKKFTNGNPSTATPATVVSADWLNAVQEEIANVIIDAGIALNKPDNTQLLAAIKALATPAGAMMEYAGAAAPSGWLLCAGQTVSRVTYAALFAAIGTTYGAGDGSTTFALPDHRGRVGAGKDNMGGTAANRLNVSLTGNTTNASASITALSSTTGLSVGMQVFGTGIPAGATILTITSSTAITISANATATGAGVSLRFGVVDGATLGAVGGSQVHALTVGQIPSHTHTINASMNTNRQTTGGSEGILSQLTTSSTLATGGDQSHPNVQPTIIVNYIIKT